MHSTNLFLLYKIQAFLQGKQSNTAKIITNIFGLYRVYQIPNYWSSTLSGELSKNTCSYGH